MNNQNIKKFNELVKGAEERHNALLDEELNQVNAATGAGTVLLANKPMRDEEGKWIEPYSQPG